MLPGHQRAHLRLAVAAGANLDVLDLGLYWEIRRNDFPKKELHPALFDDSAINFGNSLPSRAWFVAESDDILLQLQSDRFYVNWRAHGGEYPRFSDQGDRTGFKTLALREWRRFEEFAQARCGVPALKLRRIELSKVDVLERGRHWENHADLGSLLSVAKVFEQVQLSDPAHLQLRLTEQDAMGATLVTVSITNQLARIESRVIAANSFDIDKMLDNANSRLNGIFFGLMNCEEATRRFGATT